MKKLLPIIIVAIFLLSGCVEMKPPGNWSKGSDNRLILQDWAFFYFPEGINKGSVVGPIFPYNNSLEVCKKTAQEKYPEKDYFCGTECIFVWDGMTIEHCKKGVVGIYSKGEYKFIINPKIQGLHITVD
ncbi:MAG: hypothetical protein WC843_05725 [Candidatus Gracilibacteria bacterium]|jgi:hypothetical protein